MLEECIDAHHHLWRYAPEDYPWIADNMHGLRQDYLLGDLEAVTRAAGVTGTIAVQARQTVEETKWLSKVAAQSELILGVVGWAPLIDASIGTILEKLAALPKVKGMRHVLHDEHDDFYMLRNDFNRGIALLKSFGLRYDVLIFEKHLPQTIEFVDRHPGQIFIVDHLAKPRIKEARVSLWRENLRELAQRENVYCKVSGMVTEADWQAWTDEELKIYFEFALESFGPPRLMFGSDWPVLTLAASYERWLQWIKQATSALSQSERRSILYETAVEAYGL